MSMFSKEDMLGSGEVITVGVAIRPGDPSKSSWFWSSESMGSRFRWIVAMSLSPVVGRDEGVFSKKSLATERGTMPV